MCDCANGGAFITSAAYEPVAIKLNFNCQITGEILINWQRILNCIKSNQKYSLLNLTLTKVNMLLGIIQSAINYPDDYCYYEIALDEFKNIVLPLIISNAAECI